LFSDTSISINKVETNEKKSIPFNEVNFFNNKTPTSNIIGWSLAVSDIIKNDICLVAISRITDKDTNPEKIQKVSSRRAYLKIFLHLKARADSRIILILFFIFYCFFIHSFEHIYSFILNLLVFIGILIIILFVPVFFYSPKILKEDIEQDQLLSRTSSEGKIKILKISFNSNYNDDEDSTLIHHLGGIVTFLKTSEENSANLVCTNCVKIKKFKIELNENISNISVSRGDTYLLPENLFKKLDSIKDAKRNWTYLSKSIYQEFLMINTIDHQKINIELYNAKTLQLVNVFYRNCKDFLILNENGPGIFAVSTDSRLFAYTYYRDNVITIYLMESGLEVVSKKFDNVNKIRFLEFIDKDRLFIIEEEDKGSKVKFHIWLISGCLNDYFPISENDIDLSNKSDVDIVLLKNVLSKYDEYYHILSKANGKIAFLYIKDNKEHFKVLSVKRTVTDFRKDYDVTGGKELDSHDLEPWNDNAIISGKYFNDERLILIKGRNSIQLWRPKSKSFKSFEDFKNFENSNLVYISIHDNNESETNSKFYIDDDMTTIIICACKSLVYLYKHTRTINSVGKHRKFINGIINIIEDFIKRYPDNWKLMEVQYPLMAYLIYSRSSSLIKYILFGHTEKLHRPAHYGEIELNELHEYFELKDKTANVLHKLRGFSKYFELKDNPDNELHKYSDKPANDLELTLKLKDTNANDLELDLVKLRKG
jgi:hypothetical protein